MEELGSGKIKSQVKTFILVYRIFVVAVNETLKSYMKCL